MYGMVHGSLLCSNEEEMKEGIVVTDTIIGPNIEFTEAEKIKEIAKKMVEVGSEVPIYMVPSIICGSGANDRHEHESQWFKKLPWKNLQILHWKPLYRFYHSLCSFNHFHPNHHLPSIIINSMITLSMKAKHWTYISTLNCLDLTFILVVEVKNNGPKYDGSHVVLVFWDVVGSEKIGGGGGGAPVSQLVGFERVEVKRFVGEMEFVDVKINVCQELSLVDSEGKEKVVIGKHSVLVGSSSEDQVKHQIDVKVSASGNGEGLFMSNYESPSGRYI